jgi:hypothetical protein
LIITSTVVHTKGLITLHRLTGMNMQHKKKSKMLSSMSYQQKTEMLKKEKSSKKEIGVNNQNNSSLHCELFPVINPFYTSSSIIKLILKSNPGG